MIRIETEHLVLREIQIEDALQLNKICNEPNILKWMPDWKTTLEQREAWIYWVIEQYKNITKEKVRVMLAIENKDNQKLMGIVGIGNKEEVDNEIEIAYFISEEFSNNGYVTEAAKAITAWTFKTIAIEYLIAIVELDNYPSQKVVEKCGFKKLETKWILNSGETEEKPFYYYRYVNLDLCGS